jgi:type II secretory pathway pseudopilin PulG
MMAQMRSSRYRRQGLTLIELVVVLTILIALAGLLVPMVPSMLTRAHTSTCATNIGESIRAITVYQQLYGTYPNNWDALGDGKTVINYFANGSALPASAGGPGTNPGNGELTGLTLTASEASALIGAGITAVQGMATTPTGGVGSGTFDPTFNYYSAAVPTPLPITAGMTLAGMDPTGSGVGSPAYTRCVALNLSLTGRYVALGIGPRVNMVGKTIATAPVHFGDQQVLNPEYGYERLVAIFKVSDSNSSVTAFSQAQLVGVAPVHDTGLGDIGDELQNWYQLQTGGS